MDKTGTKFQFAQYRGGAPAMQDLVGNQIDLMCAEASQTLAHVRGGKMKAFAVMGSKRWPPLPDVPTMEEVGVTGMTIEFWHGMWAPKGTPKDVVARLNAAVVKALDDPAVQKRVEALGMTIPTKAELTPQSLHDLSQGRTRQVVADHQGGRHQGQLAKPTFISSRQPCARRL